MSRIVVFGAGGKAGRAVVAEAARRGHEVVAAVRDVSRYPDLADGGVELAGADLNDQAQVTALVKDADAVVNATAPGATDEVGDFFRHGSSTLAAAAAATGSRLVSIGLSAYLEVAPGVRAMDTPDFPAQFVDFAHAHAAGLAVLRSAPAELQWSVVVPAMVFDPEGERTGTYRSGDAGLLADAAGVSRISYADFAIAVLDEAEGGAHQGTHFAVAY
ncbi:NAD(P)-dependent oxidoreductase [Frankia sp. R82]|uniref:NAD(P)-dependent oxidoreductase n=1 Tax=Frankia sp. R82 TaxID=2950553 RepID=UPI00204358D7|nr:NAD(P)H-binding protein [Frankia sp. R82]MCM3887563.1 NAD(P)H-binding protein [Frankia sp. R82]